MNAKLAWIATDSTLQALANEEPLTCPVLVDLFSIISNFTK